MDGGDVDGDERGNKGGVKGREEVGVIGVLIDFCVWGKVVRRGRGG
jgi:hypothetical protein